MHQEEVLYVASLPISLLCINTYIYLHMHMYVYTVCNDECLYGFHVPTCVNMYVYHVVCRIPLPISLRQGFTYM